MKSKNFIIVLVFLLAAILSSFAYAATLQNPGFENWTGGTPDGWTVLQEVSDPAKSSLFAVESVIQGKSLHISQNDFADGADSPQSARFCFYQQVENAQVGQLYRFSIWNAPNNYQQFAHESAFGLSIGIDPWGGENSNSSNIIWQNFDYRGIQCENPDNLYDLKYLNNAGVNAIANDSNISVFVKSEMAGTVFDPSLFGSFYYYGVTLDDAGLCLVPEPTTILFMSFGSLILLGFRKCL